MTDAAAIVALWSALCFYVGTLLERRAKRVKPCGHDQCAHGYDVETSWWRCFACREDFKAKPPEPPPVKVIGERRMTTVIVLPEDIYTGPIEVFKAEDPHPWTLVAREVERMFHEGMETKREHWTRRIVDGPKFDEGNVVQIISSSNDDLKVINFREYRDGIYKYGLRDKKTGTNTFWHDETDLFFYANSEEV